MTTEHACPLCGNDNRCSAESNSIATPCWCMHSKVDQDRLEHDHPNIGGDTCLCARCLAPYLFTATASISSGSGLATDIMPSTSTSTSKRDLT